VLELGRGVDGRDQHVKPKELRGMLGLDRSSIIQSARFQKSQQSVGRYGTARHDQISPDHRTRAGRSDLDVGQRDGTRSKRPPNGPFVVRDSRVSRIGKWAIWVPFPPLER
jgi:hypothetical protein